MSLARGGVRSRAGQHRRGASPGAAPSWGAARRAPRRAFACAGWPAAPRRRRSPPPRRAASESVLLHHRHTGETLRSVYYADGRYQRSALDAATHHLRDWRDNTQLPVDPKLLDLLWSLRAALDTSGPIQVFCGYRSPETNAMLRRTRHGAARHSLHMRAMAIDLQVEGRPAAQCPPRGRGAQGRRRGLLSALRLRPRRHGRHPLLVSRPGRACHSGHGRLRHRRSVARPG